MSTQCPMIINTSLRSLITPQSEQISPCAASIMPGAFWAQQPSRQEFLSCGIYLQNSPLTCQTQLCESVIAFPNVLQSLLPTACGTARLLPLLSCLPNLLQLQLRHPAVMVMTTAPAPYNKDMQACEWTTV